MPRETLVNRARQLRDAEVRRLFGRVFGDSEGERVLLYILTAVGGLAQPRPRMSGEDRAYFDGKRDAALEIMKLAGFSPQDLAARLIVTPLITEKDLENVQDVPDANGMADGGHGRSTAIPASAIATGAPAAESSASDTSDESWDEPPGD